VLPRLSAFQVILRTIFTLSTEFLFLLDNITIPNRGDIIRELREWIDDVQAVTAIEEDEDATLYRFYTYYKIPTLRWLSHILHLKM